MNLKKYNLALTVAEVKMMNKTNVLLRLTSEQTLPPTVPGQFVQVKVNDSPRTFLRRPISINFVDEEKNEKNGNVIKVGTMVINLEEYSLFIAGTKVALTKKEIETMWTLAGNPNKVFTRDNLLDSLWGFDYFGDSRTVDSHIKRLRAKLDKVEHPGWSIKTIWGVGYRFKL